MNTSFETDTIKNQAAFLEYYDQYSKRIYYFVYRRVLSKEIAEDLTSEIFIKALKNWTGKIEVGSAWIFTIARNRVIDYYRTNKNDQAIETAFDLSSNIDLEENFSNKQGVATIKEALVFLSSSQRQILIMKFWDELDYQEISQIIGKSEAAVKMSFLRSIKILRKHLSAETLLMVLLGLIILK